MEILKSLAKVFNVFKPKTDDRELEAIVRSVQFYREGDEFYGEPAGMSFYYLELDLQTPPRVEKIASGSTRSTLSGMPAVVKPEDLDEKTIQELQPGTLVAVKGNPNRSGRWMTAAALEGGFLIYGLSSLKIGPAANPVNPTDVLVQVHSFPMPRQARDFAVS